MEGQNDQSLTWSLEESRRVPRPPRLESWLRLRDASRSSLPLKTPELIFEGFREPLPPAAASATAPSRQRSPESPFTCRIERPILPSRILMIFTLTMSFSLR